jgi:hypothetical protein
MTSLPLALFLSTVPAGAPTFPPPAVPLPDSGHLLLMRLTAPLPLVLLLSCATAPEKDSEPVADFPDADVVPSCEGLADQLSGVTSVGNPWGFGSTSMDWWCDADGWHLRPRESGSGTRPDRVLVAGWSVIEGRFFGAWEMSYDGGWLLDLSEEEAGVSCWNVETQFLAFPFRGTDVGQPAGTFMAGRLFYPTAWVKGNDLTIDMWTNWPPDRVQAVGCAPIAAVPWGPVDLDVGKEWDKKTGQGTCCVESGIFPLEDSFGPLIVVGARLIDQGEMVASAAISVFPDGVSKTDAP